MRPHALAALFCACLPAPAAHADIVRLAFAGTLHPGATDDFGIFGADLAGQAFTGHIDLDLARGERLTDVIGGDMTTDYLGQPPDPAPGNLPVVGAAFTLDGLTIDPFFGETGGYAATTDFADPSEPDLVEFNGIIWSEHDAPATVTVRGIAQDHAHFTVAVDFVIYAPVAPMTGLRLDAGVTTADPVPDGFRLTREIVLSDNPALTGLTLDLRGDLTQVSLSALE